MRATRSARAPIYLQLVRSLQVNFDYRLSAAAAHSTQGSYRLSLTVGQDTGWERTVELVPETAFSGDHVSMQGAVPLDQVQSLAGIFADQTGLKGSTYTVAVTPQIKTEGTLGGAQFAEQFAPPLRFRMDAYQLVLERPADKGDPIKPEQAGLVNRPHPEPNRFSLLGLSIGVLTTRVLSLLVLLAALTAAAVLARLVMRSRGDDEATQIEARYHSLLLRVRPAAGRGTESDQVIDVLKMEDLAKLATQSGRMILHEQEGSEHRYLVTDGGTLYRYCVDARL
jgi:uncharacterized protein DUF5305